MRKHDPEDFGSRVESPPSPAAHLRENTVVVLRKPSFGFTRPKVFFMDNADNWSFPVEPGMRGFGAVRCSIWALALAIALRRTGYKFLARCGKTG
jgi:hypothetical protein